MKILLLFLVVIYSPVLLAQQVMATAGSSMRNASGSITYTIGEGVSQTISNGDKTLTQGFHQTTLSVSSINEIKDLDFTISVYPNPTSYFVNLVVSKVDVFGYMYQLFDINGKLISQKELKGNKTSSYDPNNGKMLWECDGPSDYCAATVAFSKETVYATGGVPQRALLAIRADGTGNVSATHLSWKSDNKTGYVPSPPLSSWATGFTYARWRTSSAWKPSREVW